MQITTTGRIWSLDLPPGTPILTGNHRLHRYAAAARIKALRSTAVLLARQQHLPRIEQAAIIVRYWSPPRLKADRHPLASERIEDAENLAPASKALVDGLVQAGVFRSDSRKHVVRVTYELMPGIDLRGQLRLIIQEVV